MKLSDIRLGMTLKAVGRYADCIFEGDTYVVKARLLDRVSSFFTGKPPGLYIECGAGSHELDEDFADDEGHIPELEPAHWIDRPIAFPVDDAGGGP